MSQEIPVQQALKALAAGRHIRGDRTNHPNRYWLMGGGVPASEMLEATWFRMVKLGYIKRETHTGFYRPTYKLTPRGLSAAPGPPP